MLRIVLGAIAGVATWFVAVTLLNLGLRYGWPDYHAVEKAMTFTVPMMAARLTESTVALVMAALVTARLSRGSIAASWLLGLILLAIFAPFHYAIWDKFPVWYHLTFLTSLPLVSVVVGMMAARSPEPVV
jgi:Zn-dependent protease